MNRKRKSPPGEEIRRAFKGGSGKGGGFAGTHGRVLGRREGTGRLASGLGRRTVKTYARFGICAMQKIGCCYAKTANLDRPVK
jgi:hypothetical protein